MAEKTPTASTVRTPVGFEMPANACDCHTHVFLDPARFPFWKDRTYTPPSATPDDLLALQKALGFDRVIIVNPSVYGPTLDVTIEGIRQLGAIRARAIAVYSEDMQPDYLDHLQGLGFCGVRLNLDTDGVSDPDAARKVVKAAAAQISDRGWHLEVYLKATMIAELADDLRALPTPVVFDHFAGADGTKGLDQPGLSDVLGLLESGKIYVTLSGAYRGSSEGGDYPGFAPIAKALIAANEDHILWASDWPHPAAPWSESTKKHDAAEVRPPYDVDDGRMLNLLLGWTPDLAVREKILVTNAERLYRFD